MFAQKLHPEVAVRTTILDETHKQQPRITTQTVHAVRTEDIKPQTPRSLTQYQCGADYAPSIFIARRPWRVRVGVCGSYCSNIK
jgi:hypothetical protein